MPIQVTRSDGTVVPIGNVVQTADPSGPTVAVPPDQYSVVQVLAEVASAMWSIDAKLATLAASVAAFEADPLNQQVQEQRNNP